LDRVKKLQAQANEDLVHKISGGPPALPK
jgi:hypothetical protein